MKQHPYNGIGGLAELAREIRREDRVFHVKHRARSRRDRRMEATRRRAPAFHVKHRAAEGTEMGL